MTDMVPVWLALVGMLNFRGRSIVGFLTRLASGADAGAILFIGKRGAGASGLGEREVGADGGEFKGYKRTHKGKTDAG